MKSRLFSLFYKLAKIQTAIDAEQQRPKPDWMRLLRLKRLRLMMKDSLARLAAPAQWMVRGAPMPAYAYASANRRRRQPHPRMR